MFKPNRVYKHKKWKDISVLIQKSFFVREKSTYKIKFMYLLRLPDKTSFEHMNIFDSLEVNLIDLKNWKMISNEQTNG